MNSVTLANSGTNGVSAMSISGASANFNAGTITVGTRASFNNLGGTVTFGTFNQSAGNSSFSDLDVGRAAGSGSIFNLAGVPGGKLQRHEQELVTGRLRLRRQGRPARLHPAGVELQPNVAGRWRKPRRPRINRNNGTRTRRELRERGGARFHHVKAPAALVPGREPAISNQVHVTF
jgi:hypothetical protein